MRSNIVTYTTHELLYFLERIAAAEGPLEVLTVVQVYLDEWPKESIANLQKVDGGWAPFDRDQRSMRVNTVRDLTSFRDAVHRQCVSLKEAQLQLTPEIMELNEMLFIASRYAEAIRAPEFKDRSNATNKRSVLLNLL